MAGKTKRSVAAMIASANKAGMSINVVWAENAFRDALGLGNGAAAVESYKIERAKNRALEAGVPQETVDALEKERLAQIEAK